MRARVRKCDNTRFMFDQRLDTFIDRIKKTADEARVEVFLKTEIEHRVERIAMGATNDVGDRAVGKPGIFRLSRGGDDDPVPIALEYGTGLGITQIGAKGFAEAFVAERGLQLCTIRGLDRIERRMAVERIGTCQG